MCQRAKLFFLKYIYKRYKRDSTKRRTLLSSISFASCYNDHSPSKFASLGGPTPRRAVISSHHEFSLMMVKACVCALMITNHFSLRAEALLFLNSATRHSQPSYISIMTIIMIIERSGANNNINDKINKLLASILVREEK